MVDVGLSGPLSLQLTQFYLQTQLQGWLPLCPPDLADTLGCILHLGSVSKLGGDQLCSLCLRTSSAEDIAAFTATGY